MRHEWLNRLRCVVTVCLSLLAVSPVSHAQEESFDFEVTESPVGGRFLHLGRQLECAQKENGEVYCWGIERQPKRVAGVLFPRLVRGSGDSVCFLDRRGRLGCIGGFVHRLGERSEFLTAPFSEHELAMQAYRDQPEDQRPWVPVWLAKEVLDFDIGYGTGHAHYCVLTRQGAVACAGESSEGQVGDGAREFRADLVPVVKDDGEPLRGVRALDLTDERSCAIGKKGQLWCWGRNTPGAQAREYQGPVRFTRAARVKLPFGVAAMGEQCLISTRGEQYCWPIISADDSKNISFTPLARARCGLQPKVLGTQCTLRKTGELRCHIGPQMYEMKVSPHALVHEDWYGLCIADGDRAMCTGSERERDLLAAGFAIAAPASSSCAAEAPSSRPQSFPPHPYVRVEITREGREPKIASPTTIELLDELASSPDTYSNISTCHNPDLSFDYVNEAGEVVATITGGSCTTLAIWPASVAQLTARGNVLSLWGKAKMDEILRSLK